MFNVSASFFLSIEFQQSGYLVERIYKASCGYASGTSTFHGAHQLPAPVIRLNEFLSDTQEIGQGVVVNQGKNGKTRQDFVLLVQCLWLVDRIVKFE